MHPTTIAIDLAKSVFELAVSHQPGRIDLHRRLSRAQLLRFLGRTPPATVLLEACGSAHYWGREMQRLGHSVHLLPAHDVRRYRRGNKTDRADAKALLETFRNEDIHPVPIKSLDQQALTALHRLRTLPGIGLLTATALVAFVGDPHRFRSGRHFASYLGLTPREHSSGLARHLGRISKRGDVYIRMLLVHGARTVLWNAKRRENPDRLRVWALDLEQRRGHNLATVALANKLARIAWATWTRDENFREVQSMN